MLYKDISRNIKLCLKGFKLNLQNSLYDSSLTALNLVLIGSFYATAVDLGIISGYTRLFIVFMCWAFINFLLYKRNR